MTGAEKERSMSTETHVRLVPRDESQQLWQQIQNRWGANRRYWFWYPMVSTKIPQAVIAFEADWFHSEIPLHVIRHILKLHGVKRIYELRETSGYEYEMDLELFEPYYNGDEGFWTSEPVDWLIYASHERSLTVAGEWLVSAIKAAWPHWEHHLWRGYDFQGPPDGYSPSVRGRDFFQSFFQTRNEASRGE
jgi:hypothetical protein